MTVFTLSALQFAVRYNNCGWRVKVDVNSNMSDEEIAQALLAEFAGYEWMGALWLEFEQAARELVRDKGDWLRGEAKGYMSKQVSIYKTDTRAQA